MKDFLQQFSLKDMVDIIFNTWGSSFLIIMILSLSAGKNKAKEDHGTENIFIPYTDEVLCFYVLLFFYNVFYTFTYIFDGSREKSGQFIMEATIFLYYVMGAMLTLLLLEFIHKYVALEFEDKMLGYVGRTLQIIQLILLLLLIITPFTGALYRFNDDFYYERGWAFWIWQGYTIVAFTSMMIPLMSYYKRLNSFLKYILVSVIIFPLVAFVLGLLIPWINFNSFFVITAAILVFLQFENYRAMYTIDKVVELEDIQRKLMLDQIKPHFLHNSLNSIIYYIDKDPKKAKEALISFSKYLRTNLDSINVKSVIPFSEELQHTKQYLALEKLRFEDKLTIEYDINNTLFKVPALSLQPIVENAVKHGIRKKAEGRGTVRIITECTEDYHIIKVIDDGVGFDTGILDNMDESHIGVNNVKRRLEMDLNGTLTFESKVGTGTTCIISIPKNQ